MPRPTPRKQRQPPESNVLKEAIVFIPLAYNDGTNVPDHVFHSIHGQLFEAFQGWTLEGTVRGAYRMQSGQKRVEALQKISVIVVESRIPELEMMISEWAATLGQETMLLKITDFRVKFIAPNPEEKQS
jgi:hypothetical protein